MAFSVDQFDHYYRLLVRGEKNHRHHFKFSKDQHWTKLFPKPLLTIIP